VQAPEDAPQAPLEPAGEYAASPNGYAPAAGVPAVPAGGPLGLDVLTAFGGDLAAGQAPSIRRIRSELRIGQDKAQEVQTYLKSLTRT